ncbi:rCG24680 [Rattus norvegicus]|uniref:RCG24680 n=1 Tax=Rattus norvegicus TaxID=10116 RepID=A6JBZ6_RAT|nr:rCG24680 [Rattus norvegicus]
MLSQNSVMKLERQLVAVREEEVGRPRQREEERGAPGIVKEKSPRQNEGSRLRQLRQKALF